MIDYGFRFFEDITLFEKDAIVKHVPVRYGEKSEAFLTTKNQVRITIPRGASSQIETKIILNDQNITAPVDPNTPIGHLEIYLHGQKLNRIDLFPKEAIVTRFTTSSGINRIDPTRTDSDCAGTSVAASTDETNKEK